MLSLKGLYVTQFCAPALLKKACEYVEPSETPYITSIFFPFSASHTCQTREERALWSSFCSGKEATGHEKFPSIDKYKNWQISLAFLDRFVGFSFENIPSASESESVGPVSESLDSDVFSSLSSSFSVSCGLRLSSELNPQSQSILLSFCTVLFLLSHSFHPSVYPRLPYNPSCHFL